MARGNVLQGALLVSLSLILTEGTNPGFVGRITTKGLDHARLKGIEVLQRELPHIKLPDVSETVESFWGDLYYIFHRMKIDSFRLPNSTITPIPNVGLEISITNAYAELSGEWHWRHWLAQDEGSFDLAIEGISIPVTLKLGRDSAGRLTATTHACSTSISNVRVRISGRWTSWFYNLFDNKIGTAIRDTLVEKVCRLVSNSVRSRLQPYLQTLPVTSEIDTVSGIDYSLVGPPVATNDSLDLNLKGEFFSLAHRSAAPFPPPALHFPVDRDRMFYFGVSSYLFNTAGYVYFHAHHLTYEITDDMIPPDSPFRMNTSFFKEFVPHIEEMYPNMLMKLKVSLSSPPVLTIVPESLSLAQMADVEAFAILPNSSLAPLFMINVSTVISATAAVKSSHIVGSVKIGTLELSLTHSNMGPVAVESMQAGMAAAAEVLESQINARLEEGVPLPFLDDLRLSNLIFQQQQDFLLFGTDVQFAW